MNHIDICGFCLYENHYKHIGPIKYWLYNPCLLTDHNTALLIWYVIVSCTIRKTKNTYQISKEEVPQHVNNTSISHQVVDRSDAFIIFVTKVTCTKHTYIIYERSWLLEFGLQINDPVNIINVCNLNNSHLPLTYFLLVA